MKKLQSLIFFSLFLVIIPQIIAQQHTITLKKLPDIFNGIWLHRDTSYINRHTTRLLFGNNIINSK